MATEKFDYIKFLQNEKIKVEKKYNKYKYQLEHLVSKIQEEKEFARLKKDM